MLTCATEQGYVFPTTAVTAVDSFGGTTHLAVVVVVISTKAKQLCVAALMGQAVAELQCCAALSVHSLLYCCIHKSSLHFTSIRFDSIQFNSAAVAAAIKA